MFWKDISFDDPWFLLLLLLVPLLIFWQWRKYKQQYAELKMSSLAGVQNTRSWKARLRPILTFLKIAAFTLLVLALARPQSTFKEEKIKTEGIDIVTVIDVSGSMLAQDFKPDRLGAAKKVVTDFIENRPHDRIGLVVFAGESFTQCPVTTDQRVLKTLLSEVKSGLIADGTAIGMGLATAVNRLKESESESKVVILLTDGVNNQGFIDPLTAAEAAKQFAVKVYTIGVGTQGTAPYPARDIFGRPRMQTMEVQIDEELLEQIAQMTNGKYFRATDNQSLKNIYDEIDTLEKTEIEISAIERFAELYYPFAFLAGFFILSSILLRNTLFRGIT